MARVFEFDVLDDDEYASSKQLRKQFMNRYYAFRYAYAEASLACKRGDSRVAFPDDSFPPPLWAWPEARPA